MSKYKIWLTPDEYDLSVKCLIKLKNSLLSQGRYTDAVDDVLLKFCDAKKKKTRTA